MIILNPDEEVQASLLLVFAMTALALIHAAESRIGKHVPTCGYERLR